MNAVWHELVQSAFHNGDYVDGAAMMEVWSRDQIVSILIEPDVPEEYLYTFLPRLGYFDLAFFFRYRKKLSMSFLDAHIKYVVWSAVSMYQSLSESFMRDHAKDLVWSSISKYQKMSVPFIEEFKKELCWDTITQRMQYMNTHSEP